MQEKRWSLLSILFLFFAVFLSYGNVYNFDFVYDDEFFIVKNSFLDSFSSIGKIFSSNATAGAGFNDSFYRPLQFTIYVFVKQLLGPEAWGFHALNLTLHFLNAALFFIFALRLKFSHLTCFLIALMWAVHPIHTEAVAYKSATADPLHTFFLLLGVLVMFPALTKRRLVVGWFLFLCAIWSKETAVLGAPLFTVCLFYFSPQRWNWRTYLVSLPFWVLSLGYALLRKTILNFDGDFAFYKESNVYTENFLYRLYTFFATLPEYLRLIVWPTNLQIDRHFPVYDQFTYPIVLGGAFLCLLGLAVMLWAWFSRKPLSVLMGFIVLWFASTHLLHSGVIIPLNSLFLEHWMYMPSMAFFMLIGWSLDKLLVTSRWGGRVAIVMVLAVSLVWGQYTHAQSRVWTSSITLFSHILNLNPSVARARHGLAMAYSDLGDNEKALALYEEALRERPYPQTYHNVALIYLKRSQWEKAEEYLLKAIEIDQQFFPSYGYLAQLYYQLNRLEEARRYEQRYIELQKANR